jgi:hypothetical protein
VEYGARSRELERVGIGVVVGLCLAWLVLWDLEPVGSVRQAFLIWL